MTPLLMLLLVVLLAGLGGLVYYYFGDELTGLFSASSGTGTGTGTGPSANATDTTPPDISNIVAIPVSSSNTTAVITWTTDELAGSQVEYGPTAEMDLLSPSTPANDPTTDTSIGVTTHYVELTGLTYGSDYYYKVKSKDAAGNEAVSDGDVFKQEPSSE
jgi:phosphodiesterase/alkaline phosphatase D-like protein